MNYIRFRQAFGGFAVVTLQDIRTLEPGFHRRRLNEWQDKGYIVKLRRGHYMFSDVELNESVLFEIAGRLYSPSYISFEMALSRHQLIPESIYGVTSASTLKTCTFKTPVAAFIYRTLSPDFFFGYDIVRSGGRTFKMACPEKAFLDFLYINPHIASEDDFESLRIDKETWDERINRGKLTRYAEKFGINRLAGRLKDFERFIKHV